MEHATCGHVPKHKLDTEGKKETKKERKNEGKYFEKGRESGGYTLNEIFTNL